MNKDYLAGFFDGEGCIRISKMFRKHYSKFGDCYDYALGTKVTNTNKIVLDKCKNLYGGFVGEVKDKRKSTYKTVYSWELKSNDAVNFLKDVLPLLIVKKQEAELAIYFQTHKETLKNMDYNSFIEQLQWRDNCFVKMHNLKK